MKKIPLIPTGCGGVGRHLLQHIVSCRSLLAKLGVHLRVVGVCDSKYIVLTSNIQGEELNDSLISEICNVKSNGGCQVFHDSESKMKVIDVASILGKSTGLALADCSASSETINLLKQRVDLGCCIVLANKKPLTSMMEDYEKLVSFPRYIWHEPTVGAGLPVIASLNHIISSGDPVHRIIGSLSGTLGYVMSEVEDGKPFSQVVRLAKSLGYTEPDPRDDLSGMDVSRKALILDRLLGRQLNLESIKIESLYLQEMGPDVISVDDFLSSALLKLDENIKERVKTASANVNVLCYVFLLEGSRCEVGLQELPKNSPLGRLRGSDNVLQVYARCYKEQPLVIQGAGAGNDTTAAGVQADMLDLQDLFPSVTY